MEYRSLKYDVMILWNSSVSLVLVPLFFLILYSCIFTLRLFGFVSSVNPYWSDRIEGVLIIFFYQLRLAL